MAFSISKPLNSAIRSLMFQIAISFPACPALTVQPLSFAQQLQVNVRFTCHIGPELRDIFPLPLLLFLTNTYPQS